MNLRILRAYYKKFGGLPAIRFYACKGLLWPLVKVVLSHPFDRESYRRAYSKVQVCVGYILCEQYTPFMLERKAFYGSQSLEHKKSNIVWFCWMQGVDQAPPVVKVCLASLRRHLTDRDIRLIDEGNWRDYVSLPDYIVRKWEQQRMPTPHFTDLIRLQLLIRYGGTWIDSTVLCTGLTPQNEQATRSYLDATLFFFQYTPPGSNRWSGIGNWFITACTNNEVLLVLRDMLLAYWKDYDCLVDYFVFHRFFSMLRGTYPDEVAAMPYGYAGWSVGLGYHLGNRFKAEQWNKLTAGVCFHKLSYNVRDEVLNGKDNYYHFIMNELKA